MCVRSQNYENYEYNIMLSVLLNIIFHKHKIHYIIIYYNIII